MARRRVLLAVALAAVVAAAVVAAALSGGDESAPRDTYAVFDRSPGPEDRAPAGAAPLRTQEQAGELRYVGEFRATRFYLGRDDAGERICVFSVSAEAVTQGCSDGRDLQGGQTAQGDAQIAAVPVPDGAKARVYAGRPIEVQQMDNLVGIAFDAPVTIRVEGVGPTRDVPLAP